MGKLAMFFPLRGDRVSFKTQEQKSESSSLNILCQMMTLKTHHVFVTPNEI
jgi:hypothetical protein